MFFSKKRKEAHRKELQARDDRIDELELLTKNLLSISGKTYFLEEKKPGWSCSYHVYLRYVLNGKVKSVDWLGRKEDFSIIGEDEDAYLVLYKDDPSCPEKNKLYYVSKSGEKYFNVTDFIQRQFLQTEDKSFCKSCSAQKELYDIFERMISRRKAQIKLFKDRDSDESLSMFVKGFNACLGLFESALFDLAEHNEVPLMRTETVWLSEVSLADAEKEFLAELDGVMKGDSHDGRED